MRSHFLPSQFPTIVVQPSPHAKRLPLIASFFGGYESNSIVRDSVFMKETPILRFV